MLDLLPTVVSTGYRRELLGGLLLAGFTWSFSASAELEAGNKYAVHDYRWNIRASVWFAMTDGDFETDTRLGKSIKISANDLDYDEPYITPLVEAGFRHGRHDFWIVATIFDENEIARFTSDFEFEDEIISVGADFASDLEVTDINFRYGYSFKTFEEDGYRLGPYIAVSYTKFNFSAHEVTTGIGGSYDDTFPVPTIGAHIEYPWEKTIVVANVGGFYFDSGKFTGTGVRGEVSATWRMHEKVGLYAGFYTIYMDIDLGDEALDDFFFWGPSVGLELRF